LGKNLHLLIIFSVFAVGIFIVSLILSIIYDYLKNIAVIRIEADLTREVFKRFKAQGLGYLQNTPSAINLFRVTNDISGSSTIINVTLVHFISSLIKIITITVIIFLINPWLLLIVILYQFLVILRIVLLIKPIERFSKLSLERAEQLYKKLEKIFSNIYLLKAFGTLGREIIEYIHELFENTRLAMKNKRLTAMVSFFESISNKFFFGLLSFFGAVLVIHGKLTLGSLGAALAYISQGIGAYSTLTSMSGQLVLNKITLERLANLLDQPLPAALNATIKPQDLRRVEFNNVSFGYRPDKLILKDLSFIIEPGSHVGLVGQSGCGKTTLLNLLLGLYRTQSGFIKIGNDDLVNIDSAYFLNNVGIALQEPFLFDETIASNISYAAKKASTEDVAEAARLAGALDFINSLPDKFNTVVGENAFKLSQGQKQRIAIARALIKRPQIIILDEATSSLDVESEEKIIQNIRDSFKDSTIIIVSHRISAIAQTDSIYYLQACDRIVIGSNEKLLREIPGYSALFALKA
jgi:ATP-binding cassette subfamily B protein